MRRFVILLLTLLLAWPAAAQIKCSEGMEPIERDAESRMSAQDFVKEVATNETVFSKAFASYGYKFEVSVQTLDGDTVDGEYRRTSIVDFYANGQPRDTVTEGPVNPLTHLRIRGRDFETLREAVALTATKDSGTDIIYAGPQPI